MAEEKDNQNTQPSTGAGLSFDILRRAALVLLLISAPAFLITLQMRRHDLRQAAGADRMQQNISDLRGIINPADGNCTESPVSSRPLVREAELDAVHSPARDKGLTLLLAPTHALAAANEGVQSVIQPCGGV